MNVREILKDAREQLALSEIDDIDIEAKVVSIPTRKKTSIRSLMD